MERNDFVNSFAKRLNSLLKKEGYLSTRSRAGIEISKLAKVAGVSYQMARKYALGLALPDYHIIPKIAKWLNVSPSWLLYGEKEAIAPELKSLSRIEIESDLLKYILHKCTVLFPPTNNADKIVKYIVGMIYDVSHINADSKALQKIIDIMLTSAIQLAEINSDKRA